MEFNEKLQELRKRKGITQEELAQTLYVSRTAISKWESGRGYPNIDSLKAIAKFFSVTVDELLSPNEILTIAEEEQNLTKKSFRDLVFALLDVCSVLLVFLPFFAVRTSESIRNASLLTLDGAQPYLRIFYFTLVAAMIFVGIATLVLQNCSISFWIKSKTILSFAVNTLSVLLFVVTLQPYAAVFVFALLAFKAIIIIKR